VGPKPRIELVDGIFHVTNRGNERRDIFRDERDFLGFLHLLASLVPRFGWRCHSYCLIPNHYHLLLQTPQPNLGKGMRLLNGTYAQRFNRKYGRVGHLFQGPYRAELVVRDAHLLETCRYIALNPVRAGLCADPGQWPWSSYRALAGLAEPSSFLEVDFVRNLFDGAEGYRDFVTAGLTASDLVAT